MKAKSGKLSRVNRRKSAEPRKKVPLKSAPQPVAKRPYADPLPERLLFPYPEAIQGTDWNILAAEYARLGILFSELETPGEEPVTRPRTKLQSLAAQARAIRQLSASDSVAGSTLERFAQQLSDTQTTTNLKRVTIDGWHGELRRSLDNAVHTKREPYTVWFAIGLHAARASKDRNAKTGNATAAEVLDTLLARAVKRAELTGLRSIVSQTGFRVDRLIDWLSHRTTAGFWGTAQEPMFNGRNVTQGQWRLLTYLWDQRTSRNPVTQAQIRNNVSSDAHNMLAKLRKMSGIREYLSTSGPARLLNTNAIPPPPMRGQGQVG